MKKLIIGAIALLLFTVSALGKKEFYHSVEETVTQHGFLYDEHFVTTEDGYIIRIQRIRKPGNEQKVPMYASRPYSVDEKVFFINEPDSYGEMLIEAGYDMWFVCMRGSSGSREHVTLSVYDTEYWDFDLADQTLDHVAAIQYIIDYYNSGDEDTLDGAESGEEKPNYGIQKIHALGFSQGAGSLANAVALHPDLLNSRVSLIHYISMSVTMAFSDTFTSYPSSLTHNFEDFLSQLGIMEALTYGNAGNSILGLIGVLSPETCQKFESLLVENNGDSHMSPDAIIDSFMAGSGPRDSKIYNHFFQSITSLHNHGGSHLFDYGTEGNLEVYGQEIPPHIPYENHQMPVAMYFSESDSISSPEQNLWFAEQIGDSLIAFLQYEGKCHLSFLNGNSEDVVDDLLEIEEQYAIPVEGEEE